MASNTRVTRTMLGCSKRASVRASCRKLERPQSNVCLWRSDFGRTLMVRVAVAEVEGVVLLDRDRGAEIDVLGLVGDAEPARAHHPHDAVAAVENGIDRQSQATVQGAFPIGRVEERCRQQKSLTNRSGRTVQPGQPPSNASALNEDRMASLLRANTILDLSSSCDVRAGEPAAYNFSMAAASASALALGGALAAARMAGTTSSARSTVMKRTSMSGRMKASACMWRISVRNGA